MYVPAHFPETVQMYHDAYFWFNQCVGINIAMPMFTLIAGFLFSYFYDKGKYNRWRLSIHIVNDFVTKVDINNNYNK